MSVVVLVACLSCLWGVRAHPSGAPVDACQSLQPEHGVTPETSPSPFSITVSPNTIAQGQTATVTIGGQGVFKGFVVQARDLSTRQTVNGVFTVGPGAKTINCGQGYANTATHSSSAGKGPLSIHWTAPQGYLGSVYFTGTIAETGLRYWSGLTSSTLTIQ